MRDIWEYNKKEIIIGLVLIILIGIVAISSLGTQKEETKVEIEEKVENVVL